jgi:hypothetical protein
VSGKRTEWAYEAHVEHSDAWAPGLRVRETTILSGLPAGASGVNSLTRSWELSGGDEPGGGGYRVWREITNPGADGTCLDDCIEKTYGYDDLGNRNTEILRGGYGPGFDTEGLRTEWAYEDGRPVRKELNPNGTQLLAWQRGVDPWSQLITWHVDGSGSGFAYAYDDLGRIRGIAPITRDFSAGSNSVQEVPGSGIPLLGQHIEYLPPNADRPLRRHSVFDAECTLTDGAECSYPVLRASWIFDGQGRLTQQVERMPGGSMRSRFFLDHFQTAQVRQFRACGGQFLEVRCRGIRG